MCCSLHNLDYRVSRKATSSGVPADKLEHYERLVLTVPGIDLVTGAA